MKKEHLAILLGVVALLCVGTFTKIFIKNIMHAKSEDATQTITESISDTLVALSDEVSDVNTTVMSSSDMVEGTVDISEFEKLELDITSIDAFIEYGDEYKLEYKVYENNIPVVDQSGDTLKIKQPSSIGINFHPTMNNEYYRLTVPKSAKTIEADFEETSGKISVKDVGLEGDIKLTSGDLILENITGKELSIDMTSGDAKLENCLFEELEFDVTSGTVNLEAVGSEEDYAFNLKATSGDFRIGDRTFDDKYVAGSKDARLIKADLTSGDLNITFTE